jgi:hypothetical protein
LGTEDEDDFALLRGRSILNIGEQSTGPWMTGSSTGTPFNPYLNEDSMMSSQSDSIDASRVEGRLSLSMSLEEDDFDDN